MRRTNMIDAAHYLSIPFSLGQCFCGDGGGGGATGGLGGLILLTLAIGTWILGRWAWSVWTLRGVSNVNKTVRIAIIVGLALAVGAVVVAKRTPAPTAAGAEASPALTAPADSPVANSPQSPAAAKLPRLLDLGATTCIPCKMMAPILEELKTEYASKLQVDFIDVWKTPAAGQPYGIDSIPTQIFFDASGKELYRHTGFIDKTDILAKWTELGLDLSQK